jgi:hypothetical protein
MYSSMYCLEYRQRGRWRARLSAGARSWRRSPWKPDRRAADVLIAREPKQPGGCAGSAGPGGSGRWEGRARMARPGGPGALAGGLGDFFSWAEDDPTTRAETGVAAGDHSTPPSISQADIRTKSMHVYGR